MCGIVGYSGKRSAQEVLLNGLEKLEYRGYDSAGVALALEGGIHVVKSKGRLEVLRRKLEAENLPESFCGIGHTRWATHGEPSDVNSHPHSTPRVSIVHNGIIENYGPLKADLLAKGVTFESETDTEVLVKLIDYFCCAQPKQSPLAALREALAMVRGSYALGVLFREEPDTIYAVKKESPLIVGWGEGENFVASDIPALLKYTRRYSVLEEGDMAVVKADGIRFYDAFGKPVGSKECTEGQIFIEPQGMCVMAGIGRESGQAAQALKSVEERLDTKYGVVLHQPAYTSYQLNLGEISSYPPGYKENAGIFCHNNPWISCAEAVLGHGDRAFEVYRKTCPAYIEDISEIHRTEPYVYSQMVAGRDAPTFGEAKNSWLTGTAAWTFFNVSQYILGIQPTLDGLKVDPCIPHTLSGFTVTRRFRGATYHITVDNAAGVQHGVKSVTVDGKPLQGSVLPLAAEGAEVNVQVVMG